MKDLIRIIFVCLDTLKLRYSMIVNHIEEKEREILQYKQALHKSDRDYHTLKAEYNNLKEVIFVQYLLFFRGLFLLLSHFKIHFQD